MSANVYNKVLAQAVEIQGMQAVAAMLRVPEGTLERWLAGRAQMPLRAFLKVLEFVTDQEAHAAVASAPPADASGERLVFNSGRVSALCRRCDGTEFRRADASAPLKYTSTLVCLSCGEQVVHGNLISELARETSVNARIRFARLRKRQEDCAASLRSKASNKVRDKP